MQCILSFRVSAPSGLRDGNLLLITEPCSTDEMRMTIADFALLRFHSKVKVQGSLLFVTYTIIQGIISSEM